MMFCPERNCITTFSMSAIKKVYYPLQFLLPLIIEKLDSDVQSAKLDSLQTLVREKSLLLSKMCLWWWVSYLNIWLDICQLICSAAKGHKCGWYIVAIPFSKTEPHYTIYAPGFLSHHSLFFRLPACHNMNIRTWQSSSRDCGRHCAERFVQKQLKHL